MPPPDDSRLHTEPDPDGGFITTLFPSANASRREEVRLLREWLDKELTELAARSDEHSIA